NAEVRLTPAKIDITPLRREFYLEERVGVERELRSVRQRHPAVLADSGRHDLHAGPPVDPERRPEGDDEHHSGGRLPVGFARAQRGSQSRERAAARRRELRGRGALLGALRQAIQSAPGEAQLLERAAIAGVLAQPSLELAALGGREAAGVETPGPNRCLVVDLRLRLQSDDVAHLDSPSFTRRRGKGSPAATSSPSSSPRLRSRSRQRTSPLATCFSIVLCDKPSTCAISACDNWYTLRS